MGDPKFQGGLRFHIVNLVAAVLVLAGMFICVRGAVGAVSQIGALYSDAGGTTEEIINGPEVSEEERAERMGDDVRSMAWGAAPVAVGSLIFAVNHTVTRRRRKRLAIDQPGLMM